MTSWCGLSAGILLAGLVGCVTQPTRPSAANQHDELPSVQSEAGCEALDSAARLRLSLVEDELHADRPRAALAYLDALPTGLKEDPQAVYLRAEAFRAVADYGNAKGLYQALSAGCLAGAAYRGLGLIAAARHDLDGALHNLEQARALLSADPRVRNDYGYALLLAGRIAQAKVEFETAVELSDRKSPAAGNLVLALLVEGDEARASTYARQAALSDAQLERLRRRAATLRTQLQKERANDTPY